MTIYPAQQALSTRRAFTLVEMLVVISIIAVLAALLFPLMAQAREKARQTACMNNVRQIGLSVALYRDDYEHYVPMLLGNTPWLQTPPRTDGLLNPYLRSGEVTRCPSRTNADARYALNGWRGDHFGRPETSPQGKHDSLVLRPSSTLLAWEHQISAVDCRLGQEGGDATRPDPKAGDTHWGAAHHGGFVALWCDGRVKRMQYSDLYRRYFTIEEDPE